MTELSKIETQENLVSTVMFILWLKKKTMIKNNNQI